MRPPSDAARGNCPHGAYSRRKLEEEPITQDDEGRNGYEKYEDKRQNPCAWIKNNVGPHDTGDGAAGSECGHSGMVVEEDVRESRAYSADEIKEKVGEMAEVVFHVVAENPEEEHVSGYVQEAAVHEHAGEDGKEGGLEAAMTVERQADMVGDGGIG